MKKPGLIVRISDPCQEDWNKMQPEEQGRFCNSCSKSVIDFTGKTDAEISDILLRNNSVCGRFRKTQLNRPLNIRIDLENLPPHMSVTKRFAICLLLVFGSFLFSCKDQMGEPLMLGAIQPLYSLTSLPDTTASSIVTTTSSSEGISCESDQVLPELFDEGMMLTGEPAFVIEDRTEFYKGKPSFSIEPIDSVKRQPFTDSTAATEKEYPEPIMLGGAMVYVIGKDETETLVEKEKLINDDGNLMKGEVDLFQLYPNPGNGDFVLKYELLRSQTVRADVFDAAGNHVKTLVKVTNQHDGKYHIPFKMDGLANGIYVVSFISEGKRLTKKLVVEK